MMKEDIILNLAYLFSLFCVSSYVETAIDFRLFFSSKVGA